MKTKILLILILSTVCANAAPDFNKLADCIYKIEGGSKTVYPYGIKNINTHGDTIYARKICVNTIRNNFHRWENAGSKGDFLNYLADVYCPPSCDKIGNQNWKINIHKMLK